jgi:hypothetical protein
VPNRQKHKESNRGACIERREQPRAETDPTDWETIALRRVARHVESLSGDPDSPADPLHDCGWEEAALLALRRRIRDFKSEV